MVDMEPRDPRAPRGAVCGMLDCVAGEHVGLAGVQESVHARGLARFKAVWRPSTPSILELAEEVDTLRDSLLAQIKGSKLDVQTQLAGQVHKLGAELQELRDALERSEANAAEAREQRASEARAFTEGCQARLQQEINTVTSMLEAKMQYGFEATRTALQASYARELETSEALEKRLTEMRAELAASISVRWSYSTAMLSETRLSLDTSVAELERSLTRRLDSMTGISAERWAALERTQHERDLAETVRIKETLEVVLGERLTQLSNGLDDLARRTEEEQRSLRSSADGQLSSFRSDTEPRIRSLEERTKRLQSSVAEVENLATRRVEWLIRDVSHRRRPDGSSTWLSPKFEAAGTQGLQLELRLHAPSDQGEEGEERQSGDCTLHLWAPSGLYLVSQVFVGSASVQLQHSFDGEGPCSTGFLCFLEDQVCQDDDTLRVGVDILEAVREVEHRPRPQSAGATGYGRGGDSRVEGSILTHRYLNHRTLDLVRNQVELMQSRMVRRIEWRLEQASNLQRCFPAGECACSTTFEAAGVESLQLVFYPSGYSGAKEGYCSFFLHCPSGSSLVCWLCAGKERREARLAFEKTAYFGRTNFCRFEHCVDTSDDSILLTLEIDEAQQNVTETLKYQPVAPISARPSPNSDEIKGSLKLRRMPCRNTLEDVKQLPSIWTPRPQSDVGLALEGFHTFTDLKGRKLQSAKRSGAATARSEASTPQPRAGTPQTRAATPVTRTSTPQPLPPRTAAEPKKNYAMYATSLPSRTANL